jgi:putative membrane protein
MSEREKPQTPLNNKHKEEEIMPRDLRIPAALVRTAFSSEQSLMSWIRTCLSLFTFGFSITQFFQYLEEKQEVLQLSAGPRRLGLVLVFVGILALLLAMIDHVQRIRNMKKQGLPPKTSSFLPIGSALALLAIGIAALMSILLKWSL